MQFSFTVPDHLRIIGLEETKGGWFVYLKRRHDGSGFLQGRLGATPQEAVDACASAIDNSTFIERRAVPLPELNLDFLKGLKRK